MEAELFREIEKHTLRRDELLSKLRKQLIDFERGISSWSEIKVTLEKLRVSRRAMLRALKRSAETTELRFFGEPLTTLLEFNLWISLKDEGEQFLKLLSLAKERRSKGDKQIDDLIRYVENELASIESLEKIAKEKLDAMKNS